MNTSHRRRQPAGFTLIELLVVISVIALLAGLALPAIGQAQYQAKVTKATTQISQIRTALNAFQTEYGTFPTYGGNVADDGQGSSTKDLKWTTSADWSKLCKVLNGGNSPLDASADASAQADNPRQIVYLEFKRTDLDPNGALKDATASNASIFTYVLYTDSNYNNILKVDSAADGSSLKTALSSAFSATVAVYSRNSNTGKRVAIVTW